MVELEGFHDAIEAIYDLWKDQYAGRCRRQLLMVSVSCSGGGDGAAGRTAERRGRLQATFESAVQKLAGTYLHPCYVTVARRHHRQRQLGHQAGDSAGGAFAFQWLLSFTRGNISVKQ